MNAHASVVERQWGRPIMSSFHAAWSGGGLVGAAFGGLLISRGASVSEQLGIEALATLAIALAASFQIGAGDARPGGTAFALPERRLVALGAIAFLSVFAEAAVNDWSALYLSADVGMTHAAAASGFSGYALMMFLGRAFGDGVVHRLGRTRVVAIGALAVFAGVALAVGTASPPAVVAGFCVVGLGLANMVPAVFSASAAAATSPSLGIAMAATLAYASNLIGPPIIGAVASVSSLRAAFAMLLPASLAILALACGRRRRGASDAFPKRLTLVGLLRPKPQTCARKRDTALRLFRVILLRRSPAWRILWYAPFCVALVACSSDVASVTFATVSKFRV